MVSLRPSTAPQEPLCPERLGRPLVIVVVVVLVAVLVLLLRVIPSASIRSRRGGRSTRRRVSSGGSSRGGGSGRQHGRGELEDLRHGGGGLEALGGALLRVGGEGDGQVLDVLRHLRGDLLERQVRVHVGGLEDRGLDVDLLDREAAAEGAG